MSVDPRVRPALAAADEPRSGSRGRTAAACAIARGVRRTAVTHLVLDVPRFPDPRCFAETREPPLPPPAPADPPAAAAPLLP